MNSIKNKRGFISAEVAAILIVLGVLVLAYLGIMANKNNYEIVEKDTKELVTLQDNISVDGEFFIGTGNVDSQNYYYYMYSSGYGGLKQDKVPTKNSTVFYIENETDKPLIVEFEKDYKGFLSGIMNSLDSERKSYEIYIPKGSVLDDISINLE